MKFSVLFLLCYCLGFAQNQDNILTFEEYVGYVKEFHPLVKQANLLVPQSQANLLAARGAFDPTVEVDYDRKKFESTEYYDILNGTFKIPTWYGIELKAGMEEAEGVYLNPQNLVPEDGLYNAGISIPLAQDLLIDQRRSVLRQAKYFVEQRKADRDIKVNEILFKASMAYFKWWRAYEELMVTISFFENAQIRANAIKSSVRLGDLAAIDSLEASILVKNRKLMMERAALKYKINTLELSNYLWLENNVPVELQESVVPEGSTSINVDGILKIEQLRSTDSVSMNHPVLKSLDYRLKQLEIDRQFKLNKLLPQIDLQYNFISENTGLQTFNSNNYKAGLNLRFPLFLRKERGEYNLSKLKVSETQLDRSFAEIELQNLLASIEAEIVSLSNQREVILQIVLDYEKLLNAEERKLELGDSSLFLINSRENTLMQAKLQSIELQFEFLSAKAKLFNNLAINPTTL